MYRQSRDRLTGALPVSTPPYSSSHEDEEDYYGDIERNRESISAGWTSVGPPRRKVHRSEKHHVCGLTHAPYCRFVWRWDFSQPPSGVG